MIYEARDPGAAITQGDIVELCPLIYWPSGPGESLQSLQPVGSRETVIVLTQSCDLANAKTTQAQVAVIHQTDRLVSSGSLKAQTIRDQVRRHLVFGWYFLPEGEGFPESLVDLHAVYSLPLWILQQLIQDGCRRLGLPTPYREHLAQHFTHTYSRIALPEPYETKP